MPMPSVIENVNGMNMIVSAAESPIPRSVKSIPASLRPSCLPSASSCASVSAVIIRKPTRISAGAVACGGTIPMIGAKNMNGKKSAPAHDRDPARSPADADARRRLDVGRRGRGRGGSACDGSERVDEQRLADLGQPPLLVEIARRLADADERAHRVEEVGEEERERPDDGRDERELGEGVEVEVPEQGQVRRLVDVTRPAGARGEACGVVVDLVDDRGQDRRGDDPDQQVATDAARPQGDRENRARRT